MADHSPDGIDSSVGMDWIGLDRIVSCRGIQWYVYILPWYSIVSDPPIPLPRSTIDFNVVVLFAWPVMCTIDLIFFWLI